jgi:hypothetical protein
MASKDDLKRLIDELPDHETDAALRFLQFLRQAPAPLDEETRRWLDSGLEDAAAGIAAAEADVPEEELNAWLETTAAAVKPL